ncbi:hypothetical protein ASPCADRAFT_135031 [Aspergillus carbonarius ITEM 5010]|uniref:Uncharacterized protein n=1 Tax=Aspergillus carbonarius (strain ITEM 5010) TaxID=602072 RepID=A0A1R3R7X7_ASPC5|nr:hypothetical protein ASPCADRAFT_135031 [Aspergillus carbonarius ITEM 5010]
MSPTLDLYIAIYNEGTCPEHWALYLDDGQPSHKTLLSAKTSGHGPPKSRLESRHTRTLYEQDEVISVGTIAAVHINMVYAIAGGLKITDVGIHRLNCMGYVKDFLDTLERNRIIVANVLYWTQKTYIRARMAKAKIDYAFPVGGLNG